MKKRDIKVENSSRYWVDFEGERSTYFIFKWNQKNSIDYLQSNGEKFLEKYIEISKKYGIATPINTLEYSKLNSELFFSLYKIEDSYYYPTSIFLDVNTEFPQKMISIDPILTLDEYKLKESSHGSVPFKVELFNRENEITLICYLDNDVFNSWIDNKKTKLDPDIGGKGFWIDNSDLAYLNTPRLNSYLRDLKRLCLKFKMDDFKFENLGLEDFSQEGILFENEIIYYEDIFELLLPKYQIVK